MSDEWYCRIEGSVEGPFSARRLRTMAALGELLPTDEVRDGLGGGWRPAKFVTGLEFASETRRPAPSGSADTEQSRGERYRYKMVQIPPNIRIAEGTPKGTAAAVYLEAVVNEHASEGWEFYRVDTVGVRVNPGCLGALLLGLGGQTPVTEPFYVVTFRKPA